MSHFADWFKGSTTGKLAFIALLILLLLIPLSMVEHRIEERGLRAGAARNEVASSWGAHQTIAGPVLVLPFTRPAPEKDEPAIEDEIYRLPLELAVVVAAQSEVLNRGIYDIPVYTATVEITGTLAPLSSDALPASAVPRWEDAQLAIPIGDARSINEPVTIDVGGQTASFAPAGERIAGLGNQLALALGDLGIESIDAPLPFEISYRLRGSSQLAFLPFGDTTRVELQSDWPSPSFVGGFLPDTRDVTAAGFTASWQVLDLGRGYASTWTRSAMTGLPLGHTIQSTRFGANMIVPLSVHAMSLRATKYGVLFLALTFSFYYLFEILTPIELHTFHYLLVGLANTLFYLLLIALSEHVGFAPAFASSALASTALIGGYSAAILRAWRRAGLAVLTLASIYGYLYVTLQLEDFALLSGAIGLFVLLAAAMFFTRNIDWQSIDLDARAAAARNNAA